MRRSGQIVGGCDIHKSLPSIRPHLRRIRNCILLFTITEYISQPVPAENADFVDDD